MMQEKRTFWIVVDRCGLPLNGGYTLGVNTAIYGKIVKRSFKFFEQVYMQRKTKAQFSLCDSASVFRILVYTMPMHNDFSNCFAWVSPSTSDLKFHFLALKYKRRSPDNDFHVKNTELIRRGCPNVTLDFETSVQSGYL